MSSEERINIQDFARRYRVEVETVRSWLREGRIPYELVGSQRLILKSTAVKQIPPKAKTEEEDPVV
jgi:excisionase family DNA binding protein